MYTVVQVISCGNRSGACIVAIPDGIGIKMYNILQKSSRLIMEEWYVLEAIPVDNIIYVH